MAERGRDGKLQVTVPNYPYAEDGLLIWDAMERWVDDYLRLYYKDGTPGHQVQLPLSFLTPPSLLGSVDAALNLAWE